MAVEFPHDVTRSFACKRVVDWLIEGAPVNGFSQVIQLITQKITMNQKISAYVRPLAR